MSKDIRIEYGNGIIYIEEYYYPSGQLGLKGVMSNDGWRGYCEGYCKDGGSIADYWTGYYLDDVVVSDCNKEGYCIIWDKVIV